MNSDWKPETIKGKNIKPSLCQDQHDFHKLFYGITQAECGDRPEDTPFFLFGIRLLLHEYLGLVLGGELEPYELSDEVANREMDGFKEFINHINMELTKSGIPMKEENGKMVFDYEKIKEQEDDKWKNLT